MRVACVIHSLNGGGAERVMAGLATRLSQRGHQVTLITLDDATNDKHAVANEVQRVPLDVMGTSENPLQAVRNNLHRRKRLRNALHDARPDVVLSFCDRTNVLTLAAAQPLAVPVVVAERSDPRFQPIGRGWGWLRRRHYPRAARLVALTETSARAMQKWHAKPAAVIPSAVDLPPPGMRLRKETASAGLKQILAVGRLAWEKGFDRLIDAFAVLAPRNPQWELVIAGEGPLRDALHAQATALGLADRVRLVGWQTDIGACYRDANLFVLSSRYEGFPSALLEAMAYGLACVATDCESGPREIIRSGVDGVLVPCDAAGPLVSQIEQLMEDNDLRVQLGQAAIQRVKDFSWSKMVDAYERLLADCQTSSAASNAARRGRER